MRIFLIATLLTALQTLLIGAHAQTYPAKSVRIIASVGTVSVGSVFTINPGTPGSIAKNAGDLQSATVGTAVNIAPSVIVKDSAGNPVPSAPVVPLDKNPRERTIHDAAPWPDTAGMNYQSFSRVCWKLCASPWSRVRLWWRGLIITSLIRRAFN